MVGSIPAPGTMYETALSYLNEPAEIKQALPIAYILEQAGIHVYDNGGSLTTLCPFHDDNNPSFDIFEFSGKQRWGCWSCGISGDVFDLIQRLWPMGFRPSVDAAKRALAKMQAEGWKGPQLRDPLGWDETAASALLSQASAAYEPIEHLIAAKGWKITADHLLWHWNVRSQGKEILVPYLSMTRNLVALKHRPSTGNRPLISLPGSQLRGVFYGEWLEGDPSKPILLCEGESDTWHADMFLKEYNVIGLPAGVGATPSGLDFFHGTSNVVLAFDGDEPGRLGRERWREALQSVGCTVAYMDIPDGMDLTEVLCS